MKKALLAMVLLFAFASAAFAGWSGAVEDRNISYLTTPEPSFITAQYARAAVGPEGNIYLIWRQGGGTGFPAPAYEIYFGKSTDNGVTWSSEGADRSINSQDAQHACGSPAVGERPLDMDMDNLGNLYVVWAESLGIDDAYEIMFMKSTDQGETWQHSDTDFPISHVGVPTPNAYDPAMAIDYNNNIYVVWHQNNPNGHAEIHITKSTDLGDTWTGLASDRYISFDDGFVATNPDIAIDRNNNIYVTWDEQDSSSIFTAQILYGKSTDGGATFNCETADLPITGRIGYSMEPYMVVDLQGNVYVTWRATRNTSPTYYYEAFFSASTDGGATWSGNSGQIIVDPGAEDGSSANYPAMAVTSDGNLVIVWNETPTGYTQAEVFASYSFDGGVTWTGNTSADIVSFPDGRGAYKADIFNSPGDTLHVFWNEGVASSGYYDMHYSRGDTLGTAQATQGTIDGHVFESDGVTPIINVMVETFDSLDQRIEVDTTDASGHYQVLLFPGTYRQHFSKVGYNGYDYPGIVILPGQVTPITVNMSVVTGCQYVPGDINNNGFANGIDVVFGVNYFKGSMPPPVQCGMCPQPPPFYAAGDVNGNCSFNGIDISFYVNYLKGLVPALLYCPSCAPVTP